MIRAVFFDLDNTLLDFDRAEAAALARALGEAGVTVTEAVTERYHRINREQWELLEEGVLTMEQVMITRFDRLFGELGISGSSRTVNERYEGYLAQGHFFMPGAEETLQALAPRYPLYLASNGSARVQYSRIASAGIGGYFRRIFLSQEVGYQKPRREFFDACFAAVPSLLPSETLMVGDSLTSDIRGGRDAGMPTCWFDPQGLPPRPDIRPDHIISRLEELEPLLASL